MSEKVVVTGGAGFIGSHVVEALAKENFEIIVFDNLSTGYMHNLDTVKERIEFVKGDIRNFEEINGSLKDVKYVFHMAALSYVGESIKFPEKYNNVNIDGTLNVLKACQLNNVERYLFPSTCIVYGEAEKIPIPETSALKPNTPYGITKAIGEFYAKFFEDIYDLDTVCLRIFNAYGPRMQQRVISKFAELMLQDKSPKVNGPGTQQRDFIFVSDIVEGFLKAMRAGKKVRGKSFNIATGKGTDLRTLIDKMNKCMNKNIQAEFGHEVSGEIDVIIADTTLSKKELDFEAKVQLDEGLKKTIEWLQKNFEKKQKS